jgi:hypothetical protein
MKAFTSRHLNPSGKSEAFMPEEGSSDRASTWDIVSLDEAVDTDDGTRREGGTHLKYGASLDHNKRRLTNGNRLRVRFLHHLLPNLLCRAVCRASASLRS